MSGENKIINRQVTLLKLLLDCKGGRYQAGLHRVLCWGTPQSRRAARETRQHRCLPYQLPTRVLNMWCKYQWLVFGSATPCNVLVRSSSQLVLVAQRFCNRYSHRLKRWPFDLEQPGKVWGMALHPGTVEAGGAGHRPRQDGHPLLSYPVCTIHPLCNHMWPCPTYSQQLPSMRQPEFPYAQAPCRVDLGLHVGCDPVPALETTRLDLKCNKISQCTCTALQMRWELTSQRRLPSCCP